MISTTDEERLLSPAEVARHLGVTPWLIYSWIRTGRLPAMKFGRRVVRIRESDLAAFEEASRIPDRQSVNQPSEFQAPGQNKAWHR